MMESGRVNLCPMMKMMKIMNLQQKISRVLSQASNHPTRMNPLSHLQIEVVKLSIYLLKSKFDMVNLLALIQSYNQEESQWILMLVIISCMIKMVYLRSYTSSSPMNQVISGHW